MSSTRFKQVFVVRFFSYLSVTVVLIMIFFEFGPLIATEFRFRIDRLLGVQHRIASNIGTTEEPVGLTQSASPAPVSVSSFGSILNVRPSTILPVSTDYGLVIEKINANAKVIENIDPGNEQEYTKALSQGVAVAKGSTQPGKPGNVYIFSHSTDAPWNIIRFNAIFYLLRELVPGDRVVLFYLGRRYDYIVYDKQITQPNDTSLLVNRYNQPVLTLQTCDPPGTLLNRLVIRAKLEGY